MIRILIYFIYFPYFFMNSSAKEISTPYFNSDFFKGDGYSIEGRDDARWEAAVNAAIKLPLYKTTREDIEKIFGKNNLQGKEGNWMSYTYFYYYHPNDIFFMKNGDKMKPYNHALSFQFNPEGKLMGVSILLHPVMLPQ